MKFLWKTCQITMREEKTISSFLEFVRTPLGNDSAVPWKWILAYLKLGDRQNVHFRLTGWKWARRTPISVSWDGILSFRRPTSFSVGLQDLGRALPSVLLTFNKKFIFFWYRFVTTPGIEPGTSGWEANVLSTVLWPLADKRHLFGFFIYY